MKYNKDIIFDSERKEFVFKNGVIGSKTEKRSLDDIRNSLSNPLAKGPKYPYFISMDVCKEKDLSKLIMKNLLFGVVTYSKGTIGDEPVRSQGHIHSVSNKINYSTPEVYEIWEGEAIIYMQEKASSEPGRCFAVKAKKGDVVIVPPFWVHATINANPKNRMTFGAWCVRDFSFEYESIRNLKGIAFYPKYIDKKIIWEVNNSYSPNCGLIVKNARTYEDFGLIPGVPIYNQFENKENTFDFVVNPQNYSKIWGNYLP